MFVKLIEGAEPFAVDPYNVCALEGQAGGRDTLVIMVNGGSKLIHGMSVDTILQRFAEAKHDPDWLETEDKERASARAALDKVKRR